MVSGSDIERVFNVTTVGEWLDSQKREWLETEEHEYDLVGEILGLQISRYILWRTSHLCQSIHDSMATLLNEKKSEYEERFEKKFVDLNADVPY